MKYDNLILRYIGDDILRQISENVDISKELNDISILITNMINLMIDKNGVGIAAPQVGILKRIIVVKDLKQNKIISMINPEITWKSFDKECLKEGCLSVIEKDGTLIQKNIFRFTRIKVKYYDIEGNLQETMIKDHLLSRIVQHEIDHLNGKLFIDYL